MADKPAMGLADIVAAPATLSDIGGLAGRLPHGRYPERGLTWRPLGRLWAATRRAAAPPPRPRLPEVARRAAALPPRPRLPEVARRAAPPPPPLRLPGVARRAAVDRAPRTSAPAMD